MCAEATALDDRQARLRCSSPRRAQGCSTATSTPLLTDWFAAPASNPARPRAGPESTTCGIIPGTGLFRVAAGRLQDTGRFLAFGSAYSEALQEGEEVIVGLVSARP